MGFSSAAVIHIRMFRAGCTMNNPNQSHDPGTIESFSLGKKWHGKMCCLSLLLKTLWLFLFFHSYLQYPFKQIWSVEFFSTRRCREQSIHILISAVVVYGSFRWYKDKSSFTCHNYVLQKNTTVLLCNFIIFFSLKLLHNKSSNLKWNE